MVGYTVKYTRKTNKIMLILPLLTTLALFMIAEIDIPVEGVINFSHDNLTSLQKSMLYNK
jgi:hypothetical protein